MDIDRAEIKSKITEFLHRKLNDGTMSDSEVDWYLNILLQGLDKSIDDLVDDAITGVKNGHSVDFQFKLLELLF